MKHHVELPMLMNRKIFLGIVFLLIILSFLLAMFMLPATKAYDIEMVLRRFPGIDKVAHFFEHLFIFSVIYLIIRMVIMRSNRMNSIIAAMIFSFLISITDEFHQIFMSARTFEYEDLMANTLGTLAGLTLVSTRSLRPWITSVILLSLLCGISLLTYDSYLKTKHYYLGMEYEKKKEYSRAKEHYLIALKYNKSNAGIYNAIAWLQLEFLDEDPEQAYEYARKAVLIKDNNADYLDTFGWALFRLNRYDEALDALSKAFELKPDIFCIHYHLGAVYYKLGMLDKASYHLKEQISLKKEGQYAQRAKEILVKIDRLGSVPSNELETKT